jgi:hypothetical protein
MFKSSIVGRTRSAEVWRSAFAQSLCELLLLPGSHEGLSLRKLPRVLPALSGEEHVFRVEVELRKTG